MQVPELETPRLTLRQYQVGDFEFFAALNGNALARSRMGGPLDRNQAQLRFQRFVAETAVAGQGAWAVISRRDGSYIGHCWLCVPEGSDAADFGVILDPPVWGQGYGSEIAQVVIAHGLGRYPRVVATVDTDHVASVRMLERAGMKREREVRDEEGAYLVYAIAR